MDDPKMLALLLGGQRHGRVMEVAHSSTIINYPEPKSEMYLTGYVRSDTSIGEYTGDLYVISEFFGKTTDDHYFAVFVEHEGNLDAFQRELCKILMTILETMPYKDVIRTTNKVGIARGIEQTIANLTKNLDL